MKKKSVSLIIVIIILCLILLCGGGAYAYFCTDIFKSDKELFFKYMLNNETLSEVLSFDELEKYGEKQESTPYTSSGYVKTNNNLEISSMDSTTAELIKDTNIEFTSDVDKTNNYTYTQFDFNYSDEESLSVEYVNTNDYYGLKIESILKKFLTVENSNLKDFATNLGYESLTEYIPDEINFDSLTSQDEIFTEAEKEEIKTKYYNILSENLTDSMFTDSTSEDGQTIYTLTMTETQLENLIVKLLEQFENDETIINKLREYSINNSGLTETEADEYITEIKEEIQSLIDDLNEDVSAEVVDEEVTTYTLNLYVQNKEMTKLEINLTDTKISLSAADNAITLELEEVADTSSEETTDEDLGNITLKLQKTTTDDTFEYRLICNSKEDTVVDFQIDFTGLSELTQVEEKSIMTIDLGTGYELGYTYSNTKSFTDTLSDYVEESDLYILNNQSNPSGTITTFSELLTELNSDQMEALGVETNPMVYYIPAIIPAAMTCSLSTGDLSNIMIAGEASAVGLVVGLLVYNGNLSNLNNDNLNEQEISAFNAMLTSYMGSSISGSQVNALLNYCLSNNTSAYQNGESDKYIKVYDEDSESYILNGDGTDETYTKVPTEDTYYTVEGTYNSDTGLLTEITIKQNVGEEITDTTDETTDNETAENETSDEDTSGENEETTSTSNRITIE